MNTEIKAVGKNYAISKKHSIAICDFIRGKTITEAIALLEKVRQKRIAVPMKGEIPHKKGMAGGRYPVKASLYFIKLLKNLKGNASVKNLDADTTIIKTAIANKGVKGVRSGRRGRTGKNTHVTLTAEGKEVIKEKRKPLEKISSKEEKKPEEKETKHEESQESKAEKEIKEEREKSIPVPKQEVQDAKEIRQETKEHVKKHFREKDRIIHGEEGGRK
ncbi:MAG: hypothetical protein KJ767_02340 [Nanoarchaeota archaeon]|nr:hypothetical protein [Nanoarchaeota archaeon]